MTDQSLGLIQGIAALGKGCNAPTWVVGTQCTDIVSKGLCVGNPTPSAVTRSHVEVSNRWCCSCTAFPIGSDAKRIIPEPTMISPYRSFGCSPTASLAPPNARLASMLSNTKTCAIGGTPAPLQIGRPPFSKSLAARTFKGHVTRRQRSPLLGVRAALSEGVSLAVSQQALAFGLCTIAEGFYTRTQIQEGGGGRPEIQAIGISGAGFILASILVGSDIGLLQPLGLIGGCVTSGYVAYNCYTRFQTLESDPLEWPGPKAWPVGVALGSFFVFLALFQAFFQFK